MYEKKLHRNNYMDILIYREREKRERERKSERERERVRERVRERERVRARDRRSPKGSGEPRAWTPVVSNLTTEKWRMTSSGIPAQAKKKDEASMLSEAVLAMRFAT